MPLNPADEDSFPVGFGVSFNLQKNVDFANFGTFAPSPLVLMLSNDGLLATFYAINRQSGSQSICQTAMKMPFKPAPLGNIFFNPFRLDFVLFDLIKEAKPAPNKLGAPQQTGPSMFNFTTAHVASKPLSFAPSPSDSALNSTQSKPFALTNTQPSMFSFNQQKEPPQQAKPTQALPQPQANQVKQQETPIVQQQQKPQPQQVFID